MPVIPHTGLSTGPSTARPVSRMPPLALLAGGLATRLGPLTRDRPKSLVEVAGEPFLFHQLRLFRREGIERVVICAGHRGEQLRAALGDGSGFGLAIDWSFDGERLLGTGGALAQALPLLGPEFLVTYADSWLDIAYAPVVEAFRRDRRPALMTVYRNDGQWDASNVEFRDGEIRRYEKGGKDPAFRHIDYGLAVLRAQAFAGWSGAFDLAALYADLIRRGLMAGCEVDRRFYEIGSPAGLAETEALFRR